LQIGYSNNFQSLLEKMQNENLYQTFNIGND
jgi:hypothetical protein